ncbi:Mu transposase C-terminal domain-containing protein [Streptomyces sp. DSM 40484]|uniref:Mu transposase C-terminal domain-containing protein n=1 Tax=Streptomyces kroppenstedtii TaxID=3051181 RepID=UPI0028D44F72|nr:Mu transposase C-terminal domain-containing protein [Streptomyces sp. DSM 40484]
MGAQVTFEDRAWQVTGLVDGRVHLVAEDGATGCVLAVRLVSAPGFSVIGAAAAEPPAPALWETVPLAAQERALAWLRHIREVETGLPGGPAGGGTPRPEYDPQRFTLAEREEAKARELAALGWARARASRTTVQRRRLVYQRQGLWGLVDKRHLRTFSPTGRTDERVVAAVLEALRRRRGRSKTTTLQVIELAEQIVADTYGPARVKLPGRSSLYRLVKALADPAEPPGSAARTAAGPARSGGPPPALRPAERVHIAGARLGLQAVGEDGGVVPVAVTAALDAASGCVLAAVLHPQQDGPVQLSVLLAEMAVPRPQRPGWPALLEQAHAGGPARRLVSLPARIEATAARPAAVPETLIVESAAAVTSAVLAVCESLGISLEPAPLRTAGAKRGAVRTLAVLAGLFSRHATTAEEACGAGEAAGAYWSMPQLQDLLDEWITVRWHQRPQEQLRHPLLPRAGLAPKEMWEVLLGVAGTVPLPLAGKHYGELLPARRCALTDSGIRLGGRRYDDACLDEHRGRGQRWEVHHHPHDPRQVFVRLPDGLLHAVGWADGEHTLRPFDEMLRRRTGGVLAHRGAGGGAQPGSDQTGPLPGVAQQPQEGPAATDRTDSSAVPGTAGARDMASGSGGFGVYDAEAEARQW